MRNRNNAFQTVKRTYNLRPMIQYKQAQAVVGRTIRHAKHTYWRKYCDSVENTSQGGGRLKEWVGTGKSGAILSRGNKIAVTHKEKAGIMADTWITVHSSSTLSGVGKKL